MSFPWSPCAHRAFIILLVIVRSPVQGLQIGVLICATPAAGNDVVNLPTIGVCSAALVEIHHPTTRVLSPQACTLAFYGTGLAPSSKLIRLCPPFPYANG